MAIIIIGNKCWVGLLQGDPTFYEIWQLKEKVSVCVMFKLICILIYNISYLDDDDYFMYFEISTTTQFERIIGFILNQYS